jgi:hypothetical protein
MAIFPRIGTALGLLLVSACQAAPPVSAAPEPDVQQAPVVAPAPPVVRTYSASRATFRADELDECIDLAITATPGNEARAADQAKSFSTGRKKPDGSAESIGIAKGCAEQFAERTILATCAIDGGDDFGLTRLTARYYSVATVGDSDANMKKCLSMHGDWQANTNRWAVQHERVRGQMKQMQKIVADLESEAR